MDKKTKPHHQKSRSSPAPKGKATHVPGQGGKKQNSEASGSPGPTGNVPSLEFQGGKKQNSKTRNSPAQTRTVTTVKGKDKHNANAPAGPGTKGIASVDVQGGDEQRAKPETAQSTEDMHVSGALITNTLEREVRRVKAENHYLKTIMDYLHTNLFVGVSNPQLELKPPEDIQNDQSIIEFNNNAQKVARRFQELESELDMIYTRMFQFSSTDAEGKEGKGDTESEYRSNKKGAKGYSPENSPASTPATSEHSLDFVVPVSNEQNGKESCSNIENVSSPMEERSVFVPVLEGCNENTGHRNITDASEKTSARKNVGENKINPSERKHIILERVDEARKMITKQKDVIQKLKSDLTEAKTKLQDSQKLEEQVESLRMRLSELAGAKYSKDNANVTDLSDPNRPTKLAEQYTELYNNEWSDAFEQQCGRKSNTSEEKVIKKLLDILLAGFTYCKSIKVDQDSDLREIVLFPGRDKAKNQVNEANVKMNEVTVRHLTEVIKRSGEMTSEQVAKVFFQKKEVKEMLKKGNEGLAIYVQKCVKLCWLMQIQTPPVCIDVSAKPGDQFDKDTYREYTKKGSKIDYIVWPPLCLHESGPLLVKGVAQGK